MEYDGTVRASAKDRGIKAAYIPPPFKSSHASNILCLPGGDRLCVWFSGSGEGNPDTNIVLSRLNARSNQWEEATLLSNDPDRSEQNPLLFLTSDGKLWLLHTSNTPHNQNTSRIVRRISSDNGKSWSNPEVILSEPGTFIRNPLLVLPNGEWLLPAYRCTERGHFSKVYLSSDQGATWEEYEVPGSAGRVHMSPIQLSDGKILGFFRSRFADRIYRTVSVNGGRTWTVPEATPLYNNNSSIQATRLRNGAIVMAFNNSQKEDFVIPEGYDPADLPRWLKAPRTPISVAISKDEGSTWSHTKDVDSLEDALEAEKEAVGPTFEKNESGETLMRFPVESRELSYPSITESPEGEILLTYTYLRQCIKYVSFSEDWLTS